MTLNKTGGVEVVKRRVTRGAGSLRQAWLVVAFASQLVFGAAAAETPSFALTIKDHRYVPAEIEVPAGTRFNLVLTNADPTAEEFESYQLNREKRVAGGGTVTIFLGPLAPGTYPFFGDYNKATAQGRLIAK